MTLPQTIELEPGRPPRATVFILHGLGADGTDFLPFADELELDDVGPLRFVFPRAPVRPVTANGGAAMRAWYDIFAFGGAGASGSAVREDDEGLRESFAAVQGLLERELARGIAAERIVLAGFSQGCAITLGAAYSLGLDGEVGSIECGKRADFAVLGADPATVAPERLKDVPVWGTVQGGRVFEAAAATAAPLH